MKLYCMLSYYKNKNIYYALCCIESICFFLLTINTANAQENSVIEKTEYWGESDIYLNNQAFKMFDLIDRALTENSPSTGNAMVRKLALYNLDVMLHESRYDNSEPLIQFISSRINKVIADLSCPISGGMRIYKIYNDGFIVRTSSTIIAFDLVRGLCKGKTLISDNLMKSLAERCDILFITHNHSDHADPVVANMFINADKPVIVPPEVWIDNVNVTHWRSDKLLDKQVSLKKGQNLQVKILPGHQDELQNNIYVVTTKEGLTVAHTGDQYLKKDMAWLTNIKREIPQPDVMTIICWAARMKDFIEAFAPKVIVTAHENEMGHSIDHREAYWLTYQKMEKMSCPYYILSWGEWFDIK